MKISLSEQIAEVRRELGSREFTYPVAIKDRRLDEDECKRRCDRLLAVLKTLEWLEENRDAVRAAHRAQAEAAAAEIKRAFPDAREIQHGNA